MEQNYEWFDDAFRVEQRRWGTWASYDKDGKEIITSLTREQCLSATSWYLKAKQDGFPESVVQYDSYVGGKL